MTEIIIRGDGPQGPILPNHADNAAYNPSVAQDHTGIKFDARPRKGYKSGDPITDCTVLMTRPDFLRCPNCSGTDFRIIADNSRNASGGLVQFTCARAGCRTFWPILQMGQPQVNDIMMKRMGLVPASMPVDLILGGGDDD